MSYFYNAHTHVFTFKNVPEEFTKGYFYLGKLTRISMLRKHGILRWLIKKLPNLNKKSDADMVERLINFVKHGEGEKGEGINQSDIFRRLQSYYPPETKFIALSMDMEYMNAGEIPEKYDKQLEGLEVIKKSHPDEFFPFIFADPRRFEEHPEFLSAFIEKLQSKVFAGIKMYPALGYWPFDERLEEVYDFALEHNIPIMTHCSAGVVHDRGKKHFDSYPISTKNKIELTGKKAKDYTVHFTNPINYHALLDPKIISKHWGKEKDYSKLKICFGHFGGVSEWKKYLENPWIADKDNICHQGKQPSLKQENWNFNLEAKSGEYTWFSVICDIMEKYDNVYADVSFMLSDKDLWPLLKLVLITRKIKNRILFGTDFYMIAQKSTERALSIGLRSYLGEELFKQIAIRNVDEYLVTTW